GAEEFERRRDGQQSAIDDVAAQRTLDVAPAFRGERGPRPDYGADAVIGLAAADHRIGFDGYRSGQPGGQLRRDGVLAMSVGDDEQALACRLAHVQSPRPK